MKIKVKLFASLKLNRFSEDVREYSQGADIRRVVEDLRLPEEKIGIALLNGHHARFDVFLSEGDVLSLLPLVDGG